MGNNQNEKIKDILDDLYEIDPVLEHYEEEIKKTIKELLKSKPDIRVDQKFVSELREKIMKRVEELQYQPQKKSFSFWQMFSGPKFSYVISGMLALILFFGIFFNLADFGKVSGPNHEIIPGAMETIGLNDNAFGSLKSESQNAAVPQGRGGGGYGGGGGTQASPVAESDSAKMVCQGEGCIIPPYYPPKYVYNGEAVELKDEKIEVLRRKTKIEYTRSFSGLLESFGFGLADLSGFDNTRIQTINLVQEKEFGYSIFISSDEGIISIDAYWPKWPQTQNRCSDERCVMENTLKVSDVPGDGELIKIADNFISEHRINLSNYGEPEVDKTWNQIYYAQPVETSQIYVPDIISVKYPLLINGKFVYEQGGNKMGVSIGINIRYNKVSAVYGLSIQEYESSMYEAETDFAKILKAAEKGGLYNYIVPAEQSREIGFGIPEFAYSVIWKFYENEPTTKILLVPALVFPIDKISGDITYYGDKIVIPLAKELLEEVDYPIMPMERLDAAQ
jgi:hypothetical protein